MSETITLGKSRKESKWIVLVQPEKPFGEHLDAYRKIASKHPVSDEFSRIIIGKIHHSSPALNLITSEQFKAKSESDLARQQSVLEIVKSADTRQSDALREHEEMKALEHAEAISEKNKIIEKCISDSTRTAQEKKTNKEKTEK